MLPMFNKEIQKEEIQKSRNPFKHTIHMLQLVTMKHSEGKPKILKCVFPNCTYHVREIELALGLMTLCHICQERAMTITRATFRQVKPVCSICKEQRKKQKEKMKNLPEI